MVKQVEAFQTQVSVKSDYLHKVKRDSTTATRILHTGAKQTIIKWFHRFHVGGISYGFRQWHNYTANQRYSLKVSINTVASLSRQRLQHVLTRWKTILT